MRHGTRRRNGIGMLGLAAALVAGGGLGVKEAYVGKPYAELTDPELATLRRDLFELNKKHLAIEGYDPVSYFPEGGGEPKKGKAKFEHEHRGVVYRFASAEHLALFKASPTKFEPAYGGWCAYAMAKETYTAPNPKRFVIQHGKLMLFYTSWISDTLDDWNEEGPEKLEPLADEFWAKELQEKADEFE